MNYKLSNYGFKISAAEVNGMFNALVNSGMKNLTVTDEETVKEIKVNNKPLWFAMSHSNGRDWLVRCPKDLFV